MYYDNIEVTHMSYDEVPWVPWEVAPGAEIKLFKVDAVHGVMHLLLRLPAGTSLGQHRHTGYVQVYTVQGNWRYLEHDWVAKKGDFVYETADSIHSFETLGDEDTVIYASLNGTLEFMDEKGEVAHIESWRTMLERQMAYQEEQGLPAIDYSSFVP